MGTKAAPGFYSYLGKAEPDEPVFVLMGRDPLAPALIRKWAEVSAERGERPDKVAEAYALAKQFEEYGAAYGARPDNAVVIGDDDDR